MNRPLAGFIRTVRKLTTLTVVDVSRLSRHTLTIVDVLVLLSEYLVQLSMVNINFTNGTAIS